jgi:hypothetical protein
MKAELNENGVMNVTPETPTEVYALKQWSMAAWVMMNDIDRMENGHWRGSMLITNTTVPNVELRG